MNSETRNCQNCKSDFVIEPDDFDFYSKIGVPAPTWCPECRMIRRFNFRNEKMLFRRPDGLTGQDIFSTFSPESEVTTYENNYWFGSEWDPNITGKDYDFNKTFFTQFKDLLKVAPIPARSVFKMVNSDYCNEASESKNCYLCFNTDFIEDSAYLRKIRQVKNSFDLYECENCELSYEGLVLDKCYRTFYSFGLENCVDVWFSKNLRGCTNCFGCVNLVNKSNCYFNEQLTKEEYNKKISEFNSGSYFEIEQILKKSKEFWMKFPVKYNYSLKNINATGDRIFNSKDIKDSYYIKNSQNLTYCQDVWNKSSDCYDYSVWGDGAQNVYESMTCGLGISNIKFCFNCWENEQNLEYCGYCIGSNDCFGCIGLYKKQYCILNKQYTKEEYFELLPKIKQHMMNMPYVDSSNRVFKYGEFFPYDISPVAYNESLAQDFFPLNPNKIIENGYQYREIKNREFEKTILAKDIPDNIKDLNEDFIKEIIECENCTKAFRIIPIEFQFYKNINIPIPRKCQDCRFTERFKFVTVPKFYNRNCMNNDCNNTFITPYAPDRPEIVYCEKCYQQEMI